jgi:hypothetical protein
MLSLWGELSYFGLIQHEIVDALVLAISYPVLFQIYLKNWSYQKVPKRIFFFQV